MAEENEQDIILNFTGRAIRVPDNIVTFGKGVGITKYDCSELYNLNIIQVREEANLGYMVFVYGADGFQTSQTNPNVVNEAVITAVDNIFANAYIKLQAFQANMALAANAEPSSP